MAVTLEEIGNFLDKLEFNYKTEKDMIITGLGDETNSFMIIIKARDDGRVFDLNAHIVDKEAKNALNAQGEHVGMLLPQLLYYNYKTKFGTWEFDPSDGELQFCVEIPLEDAKMTQKQFERIISMLSTVIDEHIPEIISILKEGKKLPKEDEEEEILAMLQELLDKLEENQPSGDNDGI